MCGRYAIVNGKRVLLTIQNMSQLLEQSILLDIVPRYNAAPKQRMPVVAVRDNVTIIEMMQWGLVPHWSKEPKTAFSTINAVGEKLGESKLYAPYFRSSRCLVPADAFYEWKKLAVEKEVRGRKTTVQEKQPMCIRMKDQSPFMFAGLFSVWKSEKGEELPSYAIITTTPNELMKNIHDRMPVILEEKDFEQWLDRSYKETDQLKKLLKPYPADPMMAYPVSRLVNSPANERPECLEPLEES